jgi:hypothetical protein
MTVTSRLETINGFFGAMCAFESVGERIDFGGVASNHENADTSVTVLRGSIKVVEVDGVYNEGQEFRRPITDVSTVEAVTPGTVIFHTLK